LFKARNVKLYLHRQRSLVNRIQTKIRYDIRL